MSNNNSKIYLLTDADAKDEHLRDEVTNGIRRKNLEPVFIITGQCSRKKRDVSRKFVDDLKALCYFLEYVSKCQSLNPCCNGIVELGVTCLTSCSQIINSYYCVETCVTLVQYCKRRIRVKFTCQKTTVFNHHFVILLH